WTWAGIVIRIARMWWRCVWHSTWPRIRQRLRIRQCSAVVAGATTIHDLLNLHLDLNKLALQSGHQLRLHHVILLRLLLLLHPRIHLLHLHLHHHLLILHAHLWTHHSRHHG